MVSGIGPSATLNALGISVLVDNPHVGQNMWDHVFAGPTYRVNVETFTRLANDPAYVLEQFAGPYSLNQSGPLTNPVSDMLGWKKVPADLRAQFTPQAQADLAQFPADWPEIEDISGAGYVGQFDDLLLTQPKDGYQCTYRKSMARFCVADTDSTRCDHPLNDSSIPFARQCNHHKPRYKP